MEENIRNYNIGQSDYSKHNIQPWDIWISWRLNPFDADLLKRLLRHKSSDPREMDYNKMVHICKERIRQLSVNKIDPFDELYKASGSLTDKITTHQISIEYNLGKALLDYKLLDIIKSLSDNNEKDNRLSLYKRFVELIENR